MEQLIYRNESDSLVLEIAEDRFSATLTISDNDQVINENDLLELFKTAGIKCGFEEAKEYLVEKGIEKEHNTPFLIALGKKPKEPQVEFSLLFNEDETYQPELETDFKALQYFFKTDKDKPLAHLFITIPGKPGVNIFEEDVQSEFDNEQIINNFLGENVYFSPERSQVYSSCAGYPYLDPQGKVHVKSDFILHGDLGLNYENFELFGNLIVNGSIMEKLSLKIFGNLTIHGNINDATVEVEGDVIVYGDVTNCRQAGIIATGNVQFESAENARIVTSGQIKFKKNVHFCRMIAEQGIFGNEETSSIVGGLTQCGENIEVAILGSSSAIGTEIEITISPYVKEKMLILTKKMVKLKENYEANQDKIQIIQDELQGFESKLEESINKVLMYQDQLPRHILAYRKAYPGTYVRILKKSQTILEEIERVSYTLIEGDLLIERY